MNLMLKEIKEMTEKIEPMVGRIEVKDEKGQEMLTNMNAYIADSKHFLEIGNDLKSYEAIVWAWAILELCEELEVFTIR
ncbi:MAG: DUF357 domain-containing protein [Candidatus Aenigmarchaeota archaeon]|nr:DUF357 domain-containing protein [Candidatus Aenigmarchaeota archaeon]